MKKVYIFLYVIMAVIFSATAMASEQQGLYYWSYNGTSPFKENWYQILNGTDSGTAQSSDYPSFSVLGDGSPYSRLYVSAEDDHIDHVNPSQFSSISFWFNSTNTGAERTLFMISDDTTEEKGDVFCIKTTTETIRCGIFSGNGIQETNTETSAFSLNKWHHAVIAVNGTHQTMYLDGVLNDTQAVTTYFAEASNSKFVLGRYEQNPAGVPEWDGEIDEVKIYNRTLNQTDVTRLWQNGTTNQGVADSLSITIYSPVDNANSTTALSVLYNVDTTDGSDGTCQLYVNDAYNATDSFIDEMNSSINVSGMTNGQYNWSLECNTSSISSTNTSVYDFYMDNTTPQCDFDPLYNFINLNQPMSLGVVCTDDHFFSLNITCDGGWNYSVTGLDVASFTLNESYPANVNLGMDNCTWRACDGHTSNKISLTPISDDDNVTIIKKGDIVGRIWAEDGEIEYETADDRIKFKAKFDSASRSVFYQTYDDAVYLESDTFLGWVVSSRANTWLDMNNPIKAPVVTINHGNGLFEFRIITAEKEVEFESTGELNCVDGTFRVINAWENYGTWTPFDCPLGGSEADAIGFIGILFFFLAMIVVSIKYIRIPALDGFFAFIFFFIGLQLWSCNQWYTYFVCTFALGYLLYAIVTAFSRIDWRFGM